MGDEQKPEPIPIIVEARERVASLHNSLPTSIEVAALGVGSKAPYKVLCAREAILWRTEELARNALESLERHDFAVSAILARGVLESAALTWKLKESLETRHKISEQELDDVLMRILAGSKIWPEMPQPLQILSCMDKMNKAIPGVRRAYDGLSEFAHPNWRGVMGLFSKPNERELATYFGRGLRDPEKILTELTDLLVSSLASFELAYNKISEEIEAFLSELKSLWPEETTNESTGH